MVSIRDSVISVKRSKLKKIVNSWIFFVHNKTKVQGNRFEMLVTIYENRFMYILII